MLDGACRSVVTPHGTVSDLVYHAFLISQRTFAGTRARIFCSVQTEIIRCRASITSPRTFKSRLWHTNSPASGTTTRQDPPYIFQACTAHFPNPSFFMHQPQIMPFHSGRPSSTHFRPNMDTWFFWNGGRNLCWVEHTERLSCRAGRYRIWYTMRFW